MPKWLIKVSKIVRMAGATRRPWKITRRSVARAAGSARAELTAGMPPRPKCCAGVSVLGPAYHASDIWFEPFTRVCECISQCAAQAQPQFTLCACTGAAARAGKKGSDQGDSFPDSCNGWAIHLGAHRLLALGLAHWQQAERGRADTHAAEVVCSKAASDAAQQAFLASTSAKAEPRERMRRPCCSQPRGCPLRP